MLIWAEKGEWMSRQVFNEEDYKCPECGSFLGKDIDVGDGFLYDLCGGLSGCGFKLKKKKVNGQGKTQGGEGA